MLDTVAVSFFSILYSEGAQVFSYALALIDEVKGESYSPHARPGLIIDPIRFGERSDACMVPSTPYLR